MHGTFLYGSESAPGAFWFTAEPVDQMDAEEAG